MALPLGSDAAATIIVHAAHDAAGRALTSGTDIDASVTFLLQTDAEVTTPLCTSASKVCGYCGILVATTAVSMHLERCSLCAWHQVIAAHVLNVENSLRNGSAICRGLRTFAPGFESAAAWRLEREKRAGAVGKEAELPPVPADEDSSSSLTGESSIGVEEDEAALDPAGTTVDEGKGCDEIIPTAKKMKTCVDALA